MTVLAFTSISILSCQCRFSKHSIYSKSRSPLWE